MVKKIKSLRIFGLFILILGLCGCASFKEYRNESPKNLQLSAEIEPSTFFTKTTVELHLYRMKDGCARDYLGGVRLNGQPTEIAIEPGQKTYLEFLFIKDRRLNGASEVEYATIFTPKRGAHYRAEAKYAGHRYDVSVREVGPHGNTIQEFERQNINCEGS